MKDLNVATVILRQSVHWPKNRLMKGSMKILAGLPAAILVVSLSVSGSVQCEFERIAFCLNRVAERLSLAATQNPLASLQMDRRTQAFNLSSQRRQSCV
jgi:hypothetical protein